MKTDILGKIADIAIIAAAILATIGGTAYLFYDHHILFGITNLCLAAMAFPFVKDAVKDLIG